MGRRIWILEPMLLILAILPCLGKGSTQSETALRPLSEILNPDGTVRLQPGFEGSFNSYSFRMICAPGQAPRFVRASSSRSVCAGKIIATALSGTHYWSTEFHNSGGNDWVSDLAVSGTTLYVSGNFTKVGGVSANGIAKWDGTKWSALGSGIDGISVLAVSGTTLYAGGKFTTAGGTPANNIARWDGTKWSALGSGLNDWVSALAVSATTLYAGGYFTMAGGTPANNIARWDGTRWSALGAGIKNGYVRALAVSGTTLYAGGDFETAGSARGTSYIAKWDGTRWSALGAGMNAYIKIVNPMGVTSDNFVNFLAASGTTLYVGGDFTTAGGVSANHIAKWDGAGWSGLGLGTNVWVSSLTVGGTTLYVGEELNPENPQPEYRVAVWDGKSWSALDSGMDLPAEALAASGTTLFAGGWFTAAGGVSVDHIAKWDGNKWSALDSDDSFRTQKLDEQQSFQDYTVKTYSDADNGLGSLEIYKSGQLIYQKDGYRFYIGLADQDNIEGNKLVAIGHDLTGKGIPDLLIAEWTGGAHCCYNFYLFEIGRKFREVTEIEAQHGGLSYFKDLDGDGKLEFVGNDFTFAYVYTDFADSPAPRIILRFQSDRYVLAADLMRKPAPSVADVESKIREIRGADSWQQNAPPLELWAWMIQLIYTGQAKLAWNVYDRAWPETVPGKEDSLVDFQSKLSQSPYWPQIKKMNGI